MLLAELGHLGLGWLAALRARGCLRAKVDLLARMRASRGHGCTLPCREVSTTATQQWICESCGFVYDPADGDPDGGVPPGTAFEDIPDSWFCPVCGARKRDFVPYED